jgi:hypothetical protein
MLCTSYFHSLRILSDLSSPLLPLEPVPDSAEHTTHYWLRDNDFYFRTEYVSDQDEAYLAHLLSERITSLSSMDLVLTKQFEGWFAELSLKGKLLSPIGNGPTQALALLGLMISVTNGSDFQITSEQIKYSPDSKAYDHL